MYKNNIELIINATNRNEPPYGILSLISDTFEAMKTDTAHTEMDEEIRKQFVSSMKDLVSGMIKMDSVIQNLHSSVKG